MVGQVQALAGHPFILAVHQGGVLGQGEVLIGERKAVDHRALLAEKAAIGDPAYEIWQRLGQRIDAAHNLPRGLIKRRFRG